MRERNSSLIALLRLCLALTLGLMAAHPAPSQEQDEKKKPQPIARFVTVGSTVDDVVFGRVKNVALALQNQAAQRRTKAFLVLEIAAGSSQFHQVQGLARFLTSAELSNVTTVAWIPETVTGPNVVLALAANEIVMHPDAELGDIGRGQPLDPDELQAVVNLVERRHNTKLSPALVQGMADPQCTILKIKLQADKAEGATETRVVTEQEIQRLRNTNAIILDVQTIKDAGIPGVFSGRTARALDVLAVATANNRAEVAELYNLPGESLREDPAFGEAPRVQLIKIDDVIEPVLETFVERQISRAVASGANLLIFEINSPGGYLLSSESLANRIAELDPKQVRTVAYIPEQALSGAAIIALGCDEIYMTPKARIGDAGPIEITDGGQFERAPEKIVSVLRGSLRRLAEQKSRPAAVAMAMADKNLDVFEVTHRETGRTWYMTDDEIHRSNGEWIKGRLVPESANDLLLTVSGQRAHELKIAEPTVSDFDELKQRLGIPPATRLQAVGRTWVDTLVFVLNSKAAMFFLVVAGVVCIYLELHFTTGFLGILSALCFSLFFWSKYLGGTAGWLEIVLFVLGVACFAVEIFVIPGFGVFGISGGLMMIASLVLASQTFGDMGRGMESDFQRLTNTVGVLGGSVLAVLAIALVINRFLPRIPLFDRMVLSPPGAVPFGEGDGPRLRPEILRESEKGGAGADGMLTGRQGVAVTMLRPAGKAQIDGRFFDVVTEGPFVAQGSRIEVIEVSGNRIVVRQA